MTKVLYWTIGMLGRRHKPVSSPVGRIQTAAPMKLETYDELSGSVLIDREDSSSLSSREEATWIEDCDEQTRALLHVLSLAQGRFIRWSIRQTYRGDEFASATLRGSERTSNPIEPTFYHLDPEPTVTLAVERFTKELQGATGIDVAIEWFLMHPRYNEADFLALMTALEHLVHVFTSGKSMARLSKIQFRALRGALAKTIDDFDEIERDEDPMSPDALVRAKSGIKQGLANLNRLPFRDALSGMLHHYGVPLDGIESRIPDLVSARNDVVHRGLYRRDDPDADRLSNLVGIARELLRRTFLALLGFEGKYRVWMDGPGESYFKKRDKSPGPLGNGSPT